MEPEPAANDETARGNHGRFRRRRRHGVDLTRYSERVLVDKARRTGFSSANVLAPAGYSGRSRARSIKAERHSGSDATHAIRLQINRNGLRPLAVGRAIRPG